MFKDSVAHTKTNLYDLFYSTKTRKTYTNLGVSLLLLIVFFAFALIPTLSTLDTIRDSIVDYQNVNAGLELKIANVRSLIIQQNSTSENGGVQDELELLDKVFLQDKNLTPVYLNLKERAKISNVKILSFSPRYAAGNNSSIDELTNVPSQSSYEISLGARSNDLVSMSTFLNSLESPANMPLPSRIKSIALTDLSKVSTSVGAAGSNEVGFTADISLIIYLDTNKVTTIPQS